MPNPTVDSLAQRIEDLVDMYRDDREADRAADADWRQTIASQLSRLQVSQDNTAALVVAQNGKINRAHARLDHHETVAVEREKIATERADRRWARFKFWGGTIAAAVTVVLSAWSVALFDHLYH